MLAREDSPPVLCHEDQVGVDHEYTSPPTPIVVIIGHRPSILVHVKPATCNRRISIRRKSGEGYSSDPTDHHILGGATVPHHYLLRSADSKWAQANIP